MNKFKPQLGSTLEENTKTSYLTAEDIKNRVNDKILVVDINFIVSSEYKRLNTVELQEQLETEYKCKVFLIDGSRKTTYGTPSNNLPVYFI